MTIRQIKYFIAIYQHKNMTKASESMYVSRPVLSRALIEFEKELGLQLFIRTTNGVEATEQGHALYKTVSALISTFEETIKQIRGEETVSQKRTFRIGVLDSCGGWIYPKVITPFKRQYPDIDVCVDGILTEDVVAQLIEGKLDCAIAPLLNDGPKLIDSLHLYNSDWMLCCPKGSDFDRVTIKTLDNLPVAMLETLPPPFYSCENRVLTTRQPEMLRMAIAGGYAYAVLPSDLIVGWDDVVCKEFSPRITAEVFLLWNKASVHNEALESFLKFIATVDFKVLSPVEEAFDVKAE